MGNKEEHHQEDQEAEEIYQEGSVPADRKQSSGDERGDKRRKSAGAALKTDHGGALRPFKEEDDQDQHR